MEKISTTEQKIIREIKSGAYRDHYLIYNRKSTDEPNNQKNSIAFQKVENAKLAKREKLAIANLSIKGFCVSGVISERHSGFKEDNDVFVTNKGMVQYRIERPKFQKLVQFLSRRYFKGVICLSWDRSSRNKSDDAILGKLMRSGIDIRFAFAQYDSTSAGALHMDIDGMFATHHSRVTSEKVKLATKNLRDRGLCTYRACIGYLNTGDIYHKPFDPERAPLIKQLFKLSAQENWSIADLTRWANKSGLTTVPQRRRRTSEEMLAEEEDEIKIKRISRPMTRTQIHKILTNPFYIGKTRGNNGGYIKSISHEALITEELFKKVQSTLKSRNVSVHYTDKIVLPLRGRIRCDHCNRVYSPYRKKGHVYFRVRCAEACTNKLKSVSIDFIEKEVGELIKNLSFTEAELDEIDARTDTNVAILEQNRLKSLDVNERQKRKLREDLTYIRENRLTLLKTKVYSPEILVAEENKLSHELSSLQLQEQISDTSMHELMKEVIILSELLKHGYTYYSNASSRKKEQIIEIVFTELTLSENTFKYKARKGFKALEARFVSMGGPIGWITELSTLEDSISESISALKFILGKT